jgi:hypothetical protein
VLRAAAPGTEMRLKPRQVFDGRRRPVHGAKRSQAACRWPGSDFPGKNSFGSVGRVRSHPSHVPRFRRWPPHSRVHVDSRRAAVLVRMVQAPR